MTKRKTNARLIHKEIIRKATDKDSLILAAMNKASIRAEGHRNKMNLKQLEQRVKEFLLGEYEARILFVDNSPVGYALFRLEPDWVYVRQFFIKDAYRRKGIGMRFFKKLQKEFTKMRPLTRIEVLIGNLRALSFWQAAGFEEYCITLELGKKSKKVIIPATKKNI